MQAGRKALVAVVIGLRFVAGGPTPERPASPRRRRKGAWRRKGAPQRPPLVLVQSSDGRRGPNPDVRTTCCGCQAQARSADRREAASAGRTAAGEPVLRMPLLVGTDGGRCSPWLRSPPESWSDGHFTCRWRSARDAGGASPCTPPGIYPRRQYQLDVVADVGAAVALGGQPPEEAAAPASASATSARRWVRWLADLAPPVDLAALGGRLGSGRSGRGRPAARAPGKPASPGRTRPGGAGAGGAGAGPCRRRVCRAHGAGTTARMAAPQPRRQLRAWRKAATFHGDGARAGRATAVAWLLRERHPRKRATPGPGAVSLPG